MSQLDPYLFFDGTCAEAMRFYEKTLGGKLEMMMTQAEAPPSAGVPPGSPERIMHASLALGDRRLMASDTMAGEKYERHARLRDVALVPVGRRGRRRCSTRCRQAAR